MSDNLKAAAFAAQLTPAEKAEVDAINQSLGVHRELSNLPEKYAQQAYSSKTPAQQDALKRSAGTAPEPQRGWLSTAYKYSIGGALGLLTEASDLTTRAYRAAAIPISRGQIGFAWDEANDKGDKVFNQGRIQNAREKFGDIQVGVAMKVAAGQSLDKIIAEGSDAEKEIARVAKKGFESKDVNGTLFQDTLDAVNASKFSPGRQVANAILLGQLEGSGLFYKAISGTIDAAYRVLADPTLIAGKAGKAIQVSKYAVEVVIGANKVDEVFQAPKVINFWNTYGSELDRFKKAKASGNTAEQVAASNQLKILAPEFGPAVINSFLKAEIPVVDALSAKAFFGNAKQVDEMMKGAVGRSRVLIPTLGNAAIPGTRAFRVKTLTTANKVFDLDKVGPKLVNDLFYGAPATDDGISKQLIDGQEQIVQGVKAGQNPKTVARFSMEYVQNRIDKFKSKFEAIPFFDNDVLDVTAKDAGQKVYALARLTLPQRESKLIAAAFDNADVGRKKEIFYGLQGTILDLRGASATKEAKEIARRAQGKSDAIFAARNADGYNPSVLPDGESIGLIPSDFSNFVTTLSVKDIDRLSSRSGLIQRMAGVAHSDWVEQMTGLWSFLTLAGPRYALRNATEDLLVHVAIGESPWGLVKARGLSTRLRTVKQTEAGLTKFQKTGANPLGSVMRYINKAESEGYAKQIEEANGNVKKIREIVAGALNDGKMNRFYKQAGLGKFSAVDRELLREQIIHGDLDNALMDVVEGGKNTFTGIDHYTRAIEHTRKNKVRTAELTYDRGASMRRAKGTKGFTELAPDVVSEPSLYAWIQRIGYYSNDKLGGIAVANLADNAVGEAQAIKKITDWMRQNPDVMSQARMAERNISQEEHAQRIYDAAKQLFVKSDGKTLNKDLLSKVRAIDPETNEYVIAGKIGLDDLPVNNADLPQYIIGPTLVSVSDSGNYAASLMEWGWDWLGNANARLSREPMVLAEMIKMRKQFRSTGFEDAFIASYKRGITDEKALAKAELAAKRKLAEIVEDRSRLQVLSYVDNPAVQSQFAFSIRNFARFYRATEDFYRRLYRGVRYNPEAIRRVSLTYEGVTHSGWVQNDDQGEPYFVYPGTEHVYKVVQGAMQALGVPAEFKTPFPVEFGAKIKMITPSLNPESMVPTFAGPLAGISVKVASNLVNIFSPSAADKITTTLLGKYAEDQPMVSAFLPAHVNRIYAAMNQNDRDGQYASAMRKAMTYLEASGHGIEPKYDENNQLIPTTARELEEYRVRLKNTTLGILGMRVVYGFVAPASPTVQLKSDMADWVRENGKANFKQVWYGLLDRVGDYDTAMKEWVKLYPDQIPFTVSESDRSTVAYFRYAQESGNFVEKNQDLFKQFPQGAAFMIPHKAGYSWDAYKTMTDMGLRKNKRVEDFLREVQTAADMQTYYEKKNQYEENLKSVGTDFERSQLRQEFSDWSTLFKAGRPLVQEELAQGGKKAIERMNALNDLSAMLQDKTARQSAPKTFDKLKEMYDLYKSFKDDYDNLSEFPGGSTLAQYQKEETIVRMRELATFNENTQSAYNVLFGRLLGD